MRIALIQMCPDGPPSANLDRAVELMAQAGAGGAQLVAFAELALSRFFPQYRADGRAGPPAEPIPGPTSQRIAEAAAAYRLVTVFNMYEDAGDGRRFDSSPVFDADGRLLGVTRMIHITDFAGFHERDYYHPGDTAAPVYDTAVGRVGVAICYDRHFPEYMRALGLAGAQLVVIPQAGTVGEWPEGLYEAEVRTAAFQNGYFAALCNRVGKEDTLDFAGESFVVDPEGQIVAQAPRGREAILFADCDLARCATSTARRLFYRDRRPELYARWFGSPPRPQ
ncbi:MAG: carbon-nitrogen hydrolase family protein [Phycisphaerales bacterium]|nr:MAG: carbon-nitrogen hydrolase family protein [Phycisphaerales bacterium]